MSRWFRFRVWLADRLDALAFRVRPAYPALSMSELVQRQRNLNDAVRLMVEREPVAAALTVAADAIGPKPQS